MIKGIMKPCHDGSRDGAVGLSWSRMDGKFNKRESFKGLSALFSLLSDHDADGDPTLGGQIPSQHFCSSCCSRWCTPLLSVSLFHKDHHLHHREMMLIMIPGGSGCSNVGWSLDPLIPSSCDGSFGIMMMIIILMGSVWINPRKEKVINEIIAWFFSSSPLKMISLFLSSMTITIVPSLLPTL